ncbi:hypothetical protein D1631_09455 [Chryseobacterium nematophagum]|uniref:Lipocalin-like domain-containing protein n=1 Tax=Chryseobacterium nematophagum TaxID=2305228 RepID=A0A3M7TIV2_9FLAO|nr:lipocalin family protein [Chryseobacterium nematophagum]RNA62140.1 hypothetical protein D1631_09455 [Chryseobacterium nematophagum]
MKKQLLLFAFSMLALISCEDDNVQGYEMDMLKGEWKTSMREIVSGKDNKTVLKSVTPTGCSTKDITEFRTDYYTAYTSYDGDGIDCHMNGKIEGKFTYDTETKEMIVNYADNTSLKYKVIILSSSELKLMELFDVVDFNGDGVNDSTYITYKR